MMHLIFVISTFNSILVVCRLKLFVQHYIECLYSNLAINYNLC